MNKSPKTKQKKVDVSTSAEKLLEQSKAKNSALKKMLDFIEKESHTDDKTDKSTSFEKQNKKKS